MAGYDFYDLDELRAIPIVRVCEAFGLEKTNQRHMYKAPGRREKDGSLYLYETNGKNNFCDFGNSNTGGDTIGLVSYVTGLEWKDAVQELGRTFGIQPLERSQSKDTFELSDWQWKQIGIYGDLATKNMDFSFETEEDFAKAKVLSSKCAMSMNDLRKKEPSRYREIIKTRGISYVYALEQQYYHGLLAEYYVMKLGGMQECSMLLQSAVLEFQKKVEALRQAEFILSLAERGTPFHCNRHAYDVQADFSRIISGEQALEVGTLSTLEFETWKEKESIATADFFMSEKAFSKIQEIGFSFPYAAVQKKDMVVVTAEAEQIPVFRNVEALVHDVKEKTLRLDDRIGTIKEQLSKQVENLTVSTKEYVL